MDLGFMFSGLKYIGICGYAYSHSNFLYAGLMLINKLRFHKKKDKKYLLVNIYLLLLKRTNFITIYNPQ